jgi:hypothetical protein
MCDMFLVELSFVENLLNAFLVLFPDILVIYKGTRSIVTLRFGSGSAVW